MSSTHTEGSEDSREASRHSLKKRFSIVLSLCCMAAIVATGVISLNLLSPAHASIDDNINVDQLNKATMSSVKIVHNRTSTMPFHVSTSNSTVTPHATGITLNSYFNNVGTAFDQGTSSTTSTANFDGSHYSYSQNALVKSGLYSGASWFGNSIYYEEVVVNGTTFDWPDVAYNTADNVVATGQSISLPATANTTSLGFIGSATHGPKSGTGSIHYTDGTSQSFTLGFDDWTLNGGSVGVSSLDQIATAMTYRDAQGGVPQNIKTYLFYKGVNLLAGKTVQSVTLPNNSAIHVFSMGFKLSSFFNPYTNTGISDDANARAGNFDGSGTSYSMQETSRYVLPGDEILYNGSQMYWPEVLGGSPDNIPTSSTQTVYYKFNSTYASGKTKIGFIGSATNGPSCGTVTIHFTDSTSTPNSICFSDWTLNGGTKYPTNGNMYFLGFPDRNTSGGTKQGIKTYLYYTEILLSGSKTVSSIDLPATANQGRMHIFALGLGAGTYNTNTGSTADSNTHIFGNFDGGHYSYSSTAMQKAGVAAVQLPTKWSGIYNYLNNLNYNGVNFYWDQNFSVLPDNLVASSGQTLPLNNPTPNEDGATIPVNPVTGATHLAFLGSATGGSSSGLLTIKYADNTVQTFTLSFSDWCAATPSFGNLTAVTMPYRNTGTGSQTITNHLYYAEVTLTNTSSAPVNVEIDTQSGPGQMHIFSMGLK